MLSSIVRSIEGSLFKLGVLSARRTEITNLSYNEKLKKPAEKREGIKIGTQILPINLGMVKVFLIKGESNVLIDTGMKGMADRIIKGIKDKGLNPGDIDLIILTHVHTDHIGSLSVLKEKTGARVFGPPG